MHIIGKLIYFARSVRYLQTVILVTELTAKAKIHVHQRTGYARATCWNLVDLSRCKYCSLTKNKEIIKNCIF